MSMDSGIKNVAKYLLFAANFIIFVLALIVIGVCGYALISGNSSVDLADVSDSETNVIKVYYGAAVVILITAIFILIVSFFGCCGAWKESRCMLGTYIALVLVAFLIFVVSAIVAGTQTLDDKLKTSLTNNLNKYDPNDDKYKHTVKVWDTVQEEFKCCGVDKWEDWNTNSYISKNSTAKVPKSCCMAADNMNNCQQSPGEYQLKGCFVKVKDVVEKGEKGVMISALVIGVIMVLSLIFACILFAKAGE